jgi:hypothetical protein
MAFVRLTLLALLSAMTGAASASNLSVHFLHPEDYTDGVYSGSPLSERGMQAVRKSLAGHLEKLAQQNLPGGLTLDVDVLDIDLAGRVGPLLTPSNPNLRIVRDIDWPRMKVRYTLKRGDQVVLQKEERISDMNFQSSVNPYSPDDHFRYEKAMLDQWFPQRFSAAALAHASNQG